jgi:hypothetical protein
MTDARHTWITDDTRNKYRNDAVYHAFVDWTAAFLMDKRLTPWELEQALLLAQEKNNWGIDRITHIPGKEDHDGEMH